MNRTQSVDQLLARIEHPEWNTATGRIFDEMAVTLSEIAHGQHAKTVLAAMMVRGTVLQNASTTGRNHIQIAAIMGSDFRAINHRGDTITDVLDDLVETGLCTSNVPVDPIDRLDVVPTRRTLYYLDPSVLIPTV